MAIVGCGFRGTRGFGVYVGAGQAVSKIVLIDSNFDKSDGESMDISHGIPFGGPMKIYVGDYDDLKDA